MLRQIIDLQDTDKSQYFTITEFNKCFIIWSPSLFSYLNHSLTSAVSHTWKSMGTIMQEQNVICSKTHLDGITVQEQPMYYFVGSYMYLQVTWWA